MGAIDNIKYEEPEFRNNRSTKNSHIETCGN